MEIVTYWPHFMAVTIRVFYLQRKWQYIYIYIYNAWRLVLLIFQEESEVYIFVHRIVCRLNGRNTKFVFVSEKEKPALTQCLDKKAGNIMPILVCKHSEVSL